MSGRQEAETVYETGKARWKVEEAEPLPHILRSMSVKSPDDLGTPFLLFYVQGEWMRATLFAMPDSPTNLLDIVGHRLPATNCSGVDFG